MAAHLGSRAIPPKYNSHDVTTSLHTHRDDVGVTTKAEQKGTSMNGLGSSPGPGGTVSTCDKQKFYFPNFQFLCKVQTITKEP